MVRILNLLWLLIMATTAQAQYLDDCTCSQYRKGPVLYGDEVFALNENVFSPYKGIYFPISDTTAIEVKNPYWYSQKWEPYKWVEEIEVRYTCGCKAVVLLSYDSQYEIVDYAILLTTHEGTIYIDRSCDNLLQYENSYYIGSDCHMHANH